MSKLEVTTFSKSVSIQAIPKKLTDGELAMLALMKKKIENSDVIVESEVITIYKKHVQQFNEYWDSTANWDSEGPDGALKKYSDLQIETYAKQWFKSCLGNLVLKARLVVIPLIDIN